jgi:hypothetical protein
MTRDTPNVGEHVLGRLDGSQFSLRWLAETS